MRPLAVPVIPVSVPSMGPVLMTSLGRTWAFAWREWIEVKRDRVRLAFAFLGPLILLFTFGYGITFDVDAQAFAVLDRDRSADSRRLIERLFSSRYFSARPPLTSEREIYRRLTAGDLRLVVSIPPAFGSDLFAGRQPEIGFFLDGASTHRAETIRGYVDGVLTGYALELLKQSKHPNPLALSLRVAPRYRYNQTFSSVFAILPGSIMLIMALILPPCWPRLASSVSARSARTATFKPRRRRWASFCLASSCLTSCSVS